MKINTRVSNQRTVNRYFRDLQRLVSELGLWSGDLFPDYDQLVAEPGAYLLPATRGQALLQPGSRKWSSA